MMKPSSSDFAAATDAPTAAFRSDNAGYGRGE